MATPMRRSSDLAESSAFEALYLKYHFPLYRVALRILRYREDAIDAVQDTMLQFMDEVLRGTLLLWLPSSSCRGDPPGSAPDLLPEEIVTEGPARNRLFLPTIQCRVHVR